MEIFNSTPLKSVKYLTQLQIDVLDQANIKTVGELISIVPRKIDEILPWNENLIPNKKYSQRFEISSLIHKKSTKGLPYILLQLKYDHKFYQGFLFSRANFIVNKLRVGQKCDMVVTLFGGGDGIWTKNLIVQKIKFIDVESQVFNSAQSNLDIFYPKISSKIDTNFLRRVFSRLKPQDYVIDLNELSPFELFKSDKLDIYKLHHPESFDQFFNCQANLQILKVFLKTALQKYVVFETTKSNLALAPSLDLQWMQESVIKLPVVLTQSQKSAIWEILQDISIT